MKNIVFFDLETTGALKNLSTVRIIEISAIKINEKFEEIDKLYYKCNNDGVPIEPDAFERHGIPESDLVDCPTFTQIAPIVFKFFDGCDIGGHYCTSFDAPILFDSFLRAGINWNFRDLKIYDTFTIHTKYNSAKLGEIYKRYFGKELVNAHSANADTVATLEIFRHQAKNNQYLDDNELSAFSDRLDIMGHFTFKVDELGNKNIYMNFGKHKGKRFDEVDPSYFEWIARNESSFPIDTRFYARRLADKLSK